MSESFLVAPVRSSSSVGEVLLELLQELSVDVRRGWTLRERDKMRKREDLPMACCGISSKMMVGAR